MKKISFIIFCILIFITVFLDWEKWSIAEATSVLLTNLIQLTVVISLVTLLIWSVINLIKRWKTNKLNAILPIFIMVFVISSFTFLPISDFGIKLNYILNQSCRENVIELLEKGDLQQTDINEFAVPLKHRLTSHTGRILIQSDVPYTNDYDKVLFYVHCGSNVSSAVIYSADDIRVNDGDFGRRYCKVSKIKPKWYLVTMTWLGD